MCKANKKNCDCGKERPFFLRASIQKYREEKLPTSLQPFINLGCNVLFLTLVLMGPYVPPQSVFIFLTKISPPYQTLRLTFIILILFFLYN